MITKKKRLGENCSICNKYLADKGQLTRHFEAVHKTIKDYECDVCEEKFTAKRHLVRHKEKLHTAVKVKYPCDECGKEFNEPRTLKSFIHLKTKMYQCDTCGKQFASRGSVNLHIKGTHHGIEDHVCNICDKAFSQKGFLKMHIENIHKIKRYQCDICNQPFEARQHLKIHKNQHHNGKTNHTWCTVCNKYVSLKRLKMHIAVVHDGLKPYQCKQCHKYFSFSGNLKKHMESVHASIPI